MKIINVSQAENTEEWLRARLGRLTGTKIDAAKLNEYKTGAHKGMYKTGAGFWDIIAEYMAVPPTSENPADRGHRLENENAEKTFIKQGIDLDEVEFDTKLWVSDDYPWLACSPDAHEKTDTPTYAVECKSLSSAHHLEAVVPFAMARGKGSPEEFEKLLPTVNWESTRDFDYIPTKYQPQVVQYFVVNEKLETLWFSMYDPRVVIPELQHVVMLVKREDILDEITAQEHQAVVVHDWVKRLRETFDLTDSAAVDLEVPTLDVELWHD